MIQNETNKIEWLKNLLSIATIAGLTIAYVLICKIDEKSELIELLLHIIPNLIAALIAVLTVYYAFFRQGISNEKAISESIANDIISSLENNTFDIQSEIDKQFNLKEKLSNAKEIMLVGHSCRYIVNSLRAEMTEAVKKKTNIRIITIGRNTDASKLLMDNSKYRGLEADLEFMENILKLIVKESKPNNQRTKVGKVELKYMNWIPSCSLLFYIPKTNTGGILKLKVYAVNLGTALSKIQTHKLVNENIEKELYDYFLNQFEGLWKKGINQNLN